MTVTNSKLIIQADALASSKQIKYQFYIVTVYLGKSYSQLVTVIKQSALIMPKAGLK